MLRSWDDGLDRAGVTSPGERVQVGAGRLAETPLERLERRVGDVGDRVEAEAEQLLLGLVADAPERGDGELLDERDDLVDRDDDHAVGLGEVGGELGDELLARPRSSR